MIPDDIVECCGVRFHSTWIDRAHGLAKRQISEIGGAADQLEEVIEDDCYAFRDAMRMARGAHVHVLDIGACLGVFSFHALHLGAADVLAFEPNPIARRVLELNELLNVDPNLDCQLEIRGEAIGPAEPRRRGLLLTDGQFGGTGFTENPDAGEPVSVWTLGEAAARMWPPYGLTFLKMDIEFGEHAIFLDYTSGAPRVREDAWCWLRQFDFISIEWHGAHSDVLLRNLAGHSIVKHTAVRDDLNIICLTNITCLTK